MKFLMLMGLTGTESFVSVPNYDSNNCYIFNKSGDLIKAYEKVIEINPQHSAAWKSKVATLNRLNKFKL